MPCAGVIENCNWRGKLEVTVCYKGSGCTIREFTDVLHGVKCDEVNLANDRVREGDSPRVFPSERVRLRGRER